MDYLVGIIHDIVSHWFNVWHHLRKGLIISHIAELIEIQILCLLHMDDGLFRMNNPSETTGLYEMQDYR
jgi:hypothetical protein